MRRPLGGCYDRGRVRARGQVQRRAPGERSSVDHRRGPPRARRGGEHLVRRGLEARGAGQDRVCPPVRARHVPGQPQRGQGRAHRPGPGRRRDDERDDLARPDQLLRDDALAPARARAVARSRSDGHPPRCAVAGEPRQPAGGRQEREALVLRQPPVRQLVREAAGPPLPARTPLPPSDHRLDGRPRRGVDRGRVGLLPDLLRPEQRRPEPGWRRRSGRRAGLDGALLRADPGQSGDPAARRYQPPADARRGAPRGGRGPGAVAAHLLRVPGAGPGRRAARRHRRGHQVLAGGRAAGSIVGSSATNGSPRTSSGSASASSPAHRSGPAGPRSARACRWSESRRPSSRS